MKSKIKKDIRNYFLGDGEMGRYRVFLMDRNNKESIMEAVKDSIVDDLEKIIDENYKIQ